MWLLFDPAGCMKAIYRDLFTASLRFEDPLYGVLQYFAGFYIVMALQCYRGFTTPSMLKTDLLGVTLMQASYAAIALFRGAHGIKISMKAAQAPAVLAAVSYYGYSQA